MMGYRYVVQVFIRVSILVSFFFFSGCAKQTEVTTDHPAATRPLVIAETSRKMIANATFPSEPVFADFNMEQYDLIEENTFRETISNPLSTFSIDVDTASYSNVRRFLNQNRMPPMDAVRIEEMINYFGYDYPGPRDGSPLALSVEMSECPWKKGHQLIHLGLKAKEVDPEGLPMSNLVFLIDVSGSMTAPNKLPLLKDAFRLLVRQLRAKDKVAITVYAGAAGVVLPSTAGSEKEAILSAVDRLWAGGSTAGAMGIRLAYETAEKGMIPGQNNRVILATDGDFNVGMSSDAELVRLIEEKRNQGIFLTVLGFGMGNLKDSRMEKLADKGNGNYAYIDSLLEAKKVLVKEFASTLFTVAKDVKIQVEFNPAKVQSYRLVGYENRMMKKEDFRDDRKDAGELGAGHCVTALYEIIPRGLENTKNPKENLKYVETGLKPGAQASKEVMTVKLRYKLPLEDQSKLMVFPVENNFKSINETSDNFRFSAAVAEFGMLLRNSVFKADSSYKGVFSLAKQARGKDEEGYRAEFIRLAELAQMLSQKEK